MNYLENYRCEKIDKKENHSLNTVYKMKARIKATGEVLDVLDVGIMKENCIASVFSIVDVEIINESQTAELCSAGPDLEARRWQAAVAAMQGLITLNAENLRGNLDIPVTTSVAEYAVEYADALITELKKQKP
jgi:hypothetical protein